jgi:hypothetical protein
MDFNQFGIKKEMSASVIAGTILGTIAGWCICAALLMLGWSVVAPHLNAPMFTYWEWVAIYCGLRVIGKTLFKKG